MITVHCTECDWITDLETASDTNPTRCPKCGAEYVDAYTGESISDDENTYAIAILRQAYQPDSQNLESVDFIRDERATIVEYDTLDAARRVVADLDNEVYHTRHGESGRPEYLIVLFDDAIWIADGRGGDGSNYDWEFECENPDDDGNHCCECKACVAGLINEDRQFLLDNRVNK